MAQDERALPAGKNQGKRKSSDHLPRYFRTVANEKFLSSTLDQMMSPGLIEKVDGYFGRKDSKAFKNTDNYIEEVNSDRENYQLEPNVIVKDNLDNIKFLRDYNDFVNGIKLRNGINKNHNFMNSQEYYAWQPHINWDKFVNFREYYWLPTGPDPIGVVGNTYEIETEIVVKAQDNVDNISYIFDTTNKVSNPTLTLYKGQTYTFDIQTAGMPFTIRTAPNLSEDSLYNTGVSGQKVDTGTVVFTVDINAPERLYYVNENDIEASGLIIIRDPEDNSFINVAEQILGKKNYTMNNGYKLSNGMKVEFRGDVTPEKYADGGWYVEGVGESIRLISERDLEIPSNFLFDREVEFDNNPFDKLPFDDATSYAESKDYIVVSKGAPDRNQWSRYNRWTHRSIIETTAAINGTPAEIDQNFRASRPIIEFDAGLKLYQFGTEAKTDVDLVDTVTKDIFSTIEGAQGFYVDGIQLVNGMRLLVTADPDTLVNGRIYKVTFITHNGNKQISLVEESDSTPLENQTVLVKSGNNFKGKMFYYNGTQWNQTQDKTKVNQQPLFDIFDSNGNSIADKEAYDSSTFAGTKLFSYRQGTGANDTELGFPLSYKNVSNSGDILFDFNLLTDTFTYEVLTDVITSSIDTGYLRKYTTRNDYASVNGWTKAFEDSSQWVVRQYSTTELANNYPIDVYEESSNITDLEVKVYVNNNKLLEERDYSIDKTSDVTAKIVFTTPLGSNDKIVVKTRSSAEKLDAGFYEFPINLQNNPQNENITQFTYGQVLDHVKSIVDNINKDTGVFPGAGNLRDISDLSSYGTRFVQHSGPINLAMLHMASQSYSANESIRFAKNEYGKFKREFLRIAENLGVDTEPKQHVDLILREFATDKTLSSSFYFSDMVPYGGDTVAEYDIVDPDYAVFGLKQSFDLNNLSSRAVLVYVNGEILTYGHDYVFTDNGFVSITKSLNINDKVAIYEYETTDGCHVPPTPTKLGLYPKYKPQVYIDDTYISTFVETTGPFKLYGVAGEGQNGAGKLGWYYPLYTDEADARQADIIAGGTGQTHSHSFIGANNVFYMPESIGVHAAEDSNVYPTYPEVKSVIEGHDGSIVVCYGDYRDKLLLDLENRIYNNIKIEYDASSFDVADFIDTKGRPSVIPSKNIEKSLIVDFNQWLETVGNIDYAEHNFYDQTNPFTFNYSYSSDPQGNSLKGYWRSIYKYVYGTDRPHTRPWEMLGFVQKPTWWDQQYGSAPYTSENLLIWQDIEKGILREPGKPIKILQKYQHPDLVKYLPVDENGDLVSPINSNFVQNNITQYNKTDFKFGDEAPVETAWRRSSEFPFALLNAWLANQPAKFLGLGFDRSRITRNIAGQIIYKDTGKRITNKDLVFPNTTSDDDRVITSGIVNYMSSYLTAGGTALYDGYKELLRNTDNQMCFRVKGFTEKTKFRLILDSRTPTNEGNIFVPDENYRIHLKKSLPTDVYSYSGVVVEKVAKGFIVRGYDKNAPEFNYLAPIRLNNDPVISVGGVSVDFLDWQSEKIYQSGQIIRNNNIYYRVNVNHTSGLSFDDSFYTKLAVLPTEGGIRSIFAKSYQSVVSTIPYGTLYTSVQEVVDFLLGYGKYLESVGFIFEHFNDSLEEIENWKLSAKEFMFWTTQNWEEGTVISLSPSANNLEFEKEYHVVDDIYNNFYDYSLLKSDGNKLVTEFANTQRSNSNNFGLATRNTADGIYHIKIPVVQKEHVVVIDNETVFGDTIYDKAPGYRQERIKVLGYRTAEWNGSFDVPGFIYDDANVTDWEPWKAYSIGSLVKYKQFFYTAIKTVEGSKDFQTNSWSILDEKPEPALIANFDYKANQFGDFYDLDSANFDSDQQKVAQHLIGYQRRQYLENIIPDSVSQFKFYQGMIQDKGTKNALDKLFEKLGSANKESLELHEEWAIKVGQYGSNKGFEEFEVKIDEERLRLAPQPFDLVDSIAASDTSLIYKLLREDVYVKPKDYQHNPFPTKYFGEGYVKTAGYVNEADIDYSVLNYDDIMNIEVGRVDIGNYIWVAKYKQSWNVLKYIDTPLEIVSFIKNDDHIEITTNKIANLDAGEIIGVVGLNTAEKFYKVQSSVLNIIKVDLIEGVDTVDEPNGFITKFISARTATLAEANKLIQDTKIYNNEKLWIDDEDTGKWTVLRNSAAYEQRENIYTKSIVSDSTQSNFGSDIAVADNNLAVAVSAPKDEAGKVYVFVRNNETNTVGTLQAIEPLSGYYDLGAEFGSSVSISQDGKFIVVGIPEASNARSKYKGNYDQTQQYDPNDIITYTNQLWKAKERILPAVQTTFNTFNAAVRNYDNDYNALENSYPDVPFVLRGNFAFDNVNTDHVLILAPTDMYDASKVGDILTFDWNQFTTLTPSGKLPFDGNPTLDLNFFNGDHPIVGKIDQILVIDDTKAVPVANDIVESSTARGTVFYSFNTTDNRTIVYVKDVNGSFLGVDDLFVGATFCGQFQRQFTDGFTGYDGFFFVDSGATYTTDYPIEYSPNFVIKNLTIQGEAPEDVKYFNIYDDYQNRNNSFITQVSWLETLSYVQGQTGIINKDQRWIFRASKGFSDTATVGDDFRFYYNTLRDSNGARQDPAQINLSYDYLNDTEHTIADIWDGWCEVLFTNFDLEGNPFIPIVGTTMFDDGTGAVATVAGVQRLFDRVRVFFKNLDESAGPLSAGLDFNDQSSLSFQQNDSVTRLVGTIMNTHKDNSVAGKLIVVNSGSLIEVAQTPFIVGQEYWTYENFARGGIIRESNLPSKFNLDWEQTYNLPLVINSYSSGLNNEGAYAIYQKSSGLNYSLVNYFTVPSRGENKKLGSKVDIRQIGTDEYYAYIQSAGDGTTDNPGSIYIMKYDATLGWILGQDYNYRGEYDTIDYFVGEIVRYNGVFYQAKTNMAAQAFDPTLWTVYESNTDLLGYVPNDTGISTYDNLLDRTNLLEFGRDFDVSKDGQVLVATAGYLNEQDSSVPNNKVAVYRLSDGQYQLSQVIESTNLDEGYGETIAVSNDGKKIAVGSPFNSEVSLFNGATYIYTQNNGSFSLRQMLRPKDTQTNTRFGSNLDFDGNVLAVSSKGGDIIRQTTFDDNTTVFDAGLTKMQTVDIDSGLITIYETINDTLLYAQDFSFPADTLDFGEIIKVTDNHVYVGLPEQISDAPDATTSRGIVADFRKPLRGSAWKKYRQPIDQVNLEKIKSVYLYNTTTDSLVTYLDYIDPIQGKIAGPAEQEISFKTAYDPCRYNTVQNNAAALDNLNYTSKKFVGKLWWNIDEARFLNFYQGDIIPSLNNFNKVFPGTEVKVYEWVETTLSPDQWNAQADTEGGLAKGISGQAKYGMDAYSTRRTYDTASETFTTYYYYWVENKKTVPNYPGRTISAFEVKNFIQDPTGQAYKFVSFLANNRFALHNCESLIENKDIALHVEYWTIDKTDINIHNEYQIVTDGLDTSRVNKNIELKWFDSLIGYDLKERPVPDINLSMKQKYGILNEPRQSMFVNRIEAAKQFVERTNKVLKDVLIADELDISNLSDFDEQPTPGTGKYDTVIDTAAELRFVSTGKFRRAQIALSIANGVIVDTTIVDGGNGYINPPTYSEVTSSGQELDLRFELDDKGAVAKVNIINGGKNYSNSDFIMVRNYGVLVRNDENINGRWAVFNYNNNEWARVESQSYDVSLYWNYIDWYANGYSQLTAIDFTVDQSYELTALQDKIGEIVKINNVGTGGWLLLRKINDIDTEDYTVNYETIGRQNGTIQFKKSLYDVSEQNIGFDGSGYDRQFYDVQPIQEFRIILETLRDKILINDLAIHYNQLFFASLRYVFAEQNNVDWAFKTSFVKAKHNVGGLEQKINYQNDNLPSYEQYVREVKPYKTKIREFLSAYEQLEPSESMVTDFDLPPYYNEMEGRIVPQTVKLNGTNISTDSEIISEYPSRNWLDNIGFEIVDIQIGDAGTGYTSSPVIKITGGGGSGATAKAFMSKGRISNVIVTNSGSGYTSAPDIEIIGSLTDEVGNRPARLSAKLGNGKIRSTHVRVKFDRVTGAYLIQTMRETETFTAIGNQQIFNLKWPVNLDRTKIQVLVDGIEALPSEYSYTNVIDTQKSYVRYKGRISFTRSVSNGATVTVIYDKDISLLTASDRINLYYNPTSGMYGKDLSQLLDGIDYGGVEVTSLDFGGGSGWDSDKWMSTAFDTYDVTYEDEVFKLDGSTQVFELAQPLENNVLYNVYKNGVRIDDPNYGTQNPITNTNAVMQSITGDGVTTTVTLDEELVPTTVDDVIVIRKSTSDGSFLPDPRAYDTLLTGGDLRFQTATGLNPEDIIVDGDGFVTPTTSKGPEELVPGQILDTLDIKVFHRPGKGGSLVSSNSYLTDGSGSTFKFGILPQGKDALVVKLDGNILDQTDYTVNYSEKTVTLDTVPAQGLSVNIISLSGNGESILDIDQFTGDGSTASFLTRVNWAEDLSYYVTVNGEVVDSILETSDSSYDGNSNKAVINFGSPPPINSVINFAIYKGEERNFSQIEIDEFEGDGSTVAFELSQTPFSSTPNSHNIIVQVDNKILNAGYHETFTIGTAREYQLRNYQQVPGSIGSLDIIAFLNGRELSNINEYLTRPANSSIVLYDGVGNNGDRLDVYVRTDGEYAFGRIITNDDGTTEWEDSPQTLYLDNAPAIGSKIKVYHFSKHDIQDFERYNYDIVERVTVTIGTKDHLELNQFRAGLFKLQRPAIDAQYVWVTKNGELQTPSIDYKLMDNLEFIKFDKPLADGDVIELIQFSSDGPISPKFGFKIFKDMLNRYHFKRLGNKFTYKLAKDLRPFDLEIELDSTEGLPEPDKQNNLPGIIYMNGERIEFFIKEGNILKQLRRGTLGTGVPALHEAGVDVYDQGPQQTVPYSDETIINTFDADGSTNTFSLGFNPKSNDEIEVFVGGRRLRKNAISVYDATQDQDSPEGDVTVAAEYSIDSQTDIITLVEAPESGARVQIVRKLGKIWQQTGESLETTDNLISRFLKAEKVELPK